MKSKQVNFRLDENLKNRVKAASERLGMDESTIIRECIRAFVEAVEDRGCLTFPLEITNEEERQFLQRLKNKKQ